MKRIVLPVLLLVILFLALAGAGILPWTLWLAALLLSAALCLATRRHDTPSAGSLAGILRIETIGMAIILLVLASALPLPPPLDRITGEKRTAQNARVSRVLDDARSLELIDATGTDAFSLSRNRAGTLRTVLLLVAAFSALTLASGLAPAGRLVLLRVIQALGAGIALAGLISMFRLPQGDTLLWFIPVEHCLPGPVACFVNPNHFAGFLAMLVPSVFVAVAEDFRLRRWAGLAFSVACAIIMGMGVAASLSRGAILACAAGLLITAGVLVWNRRYLPAASLTVFVGVFAVAVWSLPSQPLRDELRTLADPSQTPSFQARENAWRDTLATWKAYPALGVGMNALRTTYPQHRHTASRGYLTHAENEYVQLLAEGGLVGAGLAFLLAAFMAVQIRQSIRRTPPDLFLLAAGFGSAAVAATHAVIDFALHIPLYAVTLATLLGLLLSPSGAAPRPARSPAGRPAPGAFPSIGRWAAILLLLTAAFLAPWIPDLARLDSPPALKTASAGELARALTWAPTCARSWYYFGRLACAHNTPETVKLGETCLTTAVACDPNNYPIWNQLGLLRMKLGDTPGARQAFDRVRELRPWVKTPALPAEDQP